VARKQWSFNTDLRRAAQQEIPLFTQDDDYDVVVVADELGDFGEYVPYNTWLPRPVVGTQGLTPTAWHRVIEQWGAAQLQSRFEKRAGRWMNSTDYGAWLALRAVGEAAALTGSLDPQTISTKLLDPQFRMGGYKGRQLSFRSWSGQLRQPIPLVHPRALTSQSPQTGYLHPVTDLDTLGYDHSESNCQLNPQLRVLAHGIRA
jgi:ABC transporter substrate binding protein (PQQ-dependent alcohol dehydrogenase system)